jgi:TolA-binding protein
MPSPLRHGAVIATEETTVIDFETMGLRMGFSNALAAQANSADEAMHRANEIIARKNVRIDELSEETRVLNGRIEALRRELDSERRRSATARDARETQWKQHLAKVREEHRLSIAIYATHAQAGNLTLAEILATLDEAAPGNQWSTPTGRSYPDGRQQIGLGEYYDLAFDALMERDGIPEPHRHRMVAEPAA